MTHTTATGQTLHLAAPLSFEAAAGDRLPAKFSGVAYSGGLIPSYGAVIDLSTTTVSRKMPLLDAHSRSEVIGVVDAAEVGSAINVGGQLFSDMGDSPASRIAQRAKRGAPYQMSVGLFNYRELQVPAGQSIRVNGQDFSGPVTVLQGGMVREVSIVTLGADPAADARFFSLAGASGATAATLDSAWRELAAAGRALSIALAAAQEGLALRPHVPAKPDHRRHAAVPPRLLSAVDIYARRRLAQAAAAELMASGRLEGDETDAADSTNGLPSPVSVYARRRRQLQ